MTSHARAAAAQDALQATEWACLKKVRAETNEDKFWRTRQAGALVESWWGRSGTVGQRRVKEHPSQYEAERATREAHLKKRGDGYELDEAANAECNADIRRTNQRRQRLLAAQEGMTSGRRPVYAQHDVRGGDGAVTHIRGSVQVLPSAVAREVVEGSRGAYAFHHPDDPPSFGPTARSEGMRVTAAETQPAPPQPVQRPMIAIRPQQGGGQRRSREDLEPELSALQLAAQEWRGPRVGVRSVRLGAEWTGRPADVATEIANSYVDFTIPRHVAREALAAVARDMQRISGERSALRGGAVHPSDVLELHFRTFQSDPDSASLVPPAHHNARSQVTPRTPPQVFGAVPQPRDEAARRLASQPVPQGAREHAVRPPELVDVPWWEFQCDTNAEVRRIRLAGCYYEEERGVVNRPHGTRCYRFVTQSLDTERDANRRAARYFHARAAGWVAEGWYLTDYTPEARELSRRRSMENAATLALEAEERERREAAEAEEQSRRLAATVALSRFDGLTDDEEI